MWRNREGGWLAEAGGVHVHSLPQTLQGGSERHLIHTLRGVG